MRPVVFLDFDGVLNSHDSRAENGRSSLDMAMVGRLNRLLEATGAQVVVSSKWRLYETFTRLVEILRGHGFTGEVIGTTDDLGDDRAGEIAAWLRVGGQGRPYVVLDDRDDLGALGPRVVLANEDYGLTDADVDRAIALLTAGTIAA